jgi:hypothetical protein
MSGEEDWLGPRSRARGGAGARVREPAGVARSAVSVPAVWVVLACDERIRTA